MRIYIGREFGAPMSDVRAMARFWRQKAPRPNVVVVVVFEKRNLLTSGAIDDLGILRLAIAFALTRLPSVLYYCLDVCWLESCVVVLVVLGV